LCRTLGRTLGELGATMSSQEFSVWMDEYAREPWGDNRADLHAAMLGATIANHAGKMRKQPAKLTEFLLDFRRTEEKESDPAEFFDMLNRGR
jgi:hypothetical protein